MIFFFTLSAKSASCIKLVLESSELFLAPMTTSSTSNQVVGNEVYDSHELWNAMSGMESKIEQWLKEVSLDLHQSLQQITYQFTTQITEI